MNDTFLQWLASAWPVIVPTITIVIAYLQLKRHTNDAIDVAKENREAAEQRDRQIRSELALLDANIRISISAVIENKMERLEKKLDTIDRRTNELEVNVAAIKERTQRQ